MRHQPAAAMGTHGACRGFVEPVLETNSQECPRENLLLQIPHKCQVSVWWMGWSSSQDALRSSSSNCPQEQQ